MAYTPTISELVTTVIELEVEDLTEWEAQFVSSIKRQITAGKKPEDLSDRQLAVVQRIWAQYC